MLTTRLLFLSDEELGRLIFRQTGTQELWMLFNDFGLKLSGSKGVKMGRVPPKDFRKIGREVRARMNMLSDEYIRELEEGLA